MPDPRRSDDAQSGNRYPECGGSVTGRDLQIPYRGERVLFFVNVCGCGIQIERLRQPTDSDEVPCIFCDRIESGGLPWIQHTHETTERIW